MTANSYEVELINRNLLSGDKSSKSIWALIFKTKNKNEFSYQAGGHMILRPPNTKDIILNFFEQIKESNPSPTKFKELQWSGYDLSRPSKLNPGKFLPMRRRYYSIASSPRESPECILLIIRHLKRTDAFPGGVTSHYLCEELALKESISITLGSSCFCNLTNAPVIFIATGTGIAAFRGIIIERIEDNLLSWLIMGDRDEEEDFIYKELWNNLKKSDCFSICTAFSRKKTTTCFGYVQDAIWSFKKNIWHWIEKYNAKICLAGKPEMGKAVLETLSEIAQQNGKNTNWIKTQLKEERILQELY